MAAARNSVSGEIRSGALRIHFCLRKKYESL